MIRGGSPDKLNVGFDLVSLFQEGEKGGPSETPLPRQHKMDPHGPPSVYVYVCVDIYIYVCIRMFVCTCTTNTEFIHFLGTRMYIHIYTRMCT